MKNIKKEFVYEDELFDKDNELFDEDNELFDEDNELFDEELDQESEEQNSYSKDRDGYITEIDFYPPSDNRVWKSNIEDIDGGDNFADFCKDFFARLDEENYYNN